MSPEDQVIVLKLALAVIIACAGLLWAIPTECRCQYCTTHVTERTRKAEASRVKRHREAHSYWRIPWGDTRCPSCKAGNDRDEPRG